MRLVIIRWLPVLILGAVVLVAASTLLMAHVTLPARMSVVLSRTSVLRDPEPVPTPARPTLRVAVAAMLTPETSFEAYRTLIILLGAKLGLDTEFVQRPSYAAVNELLAAGKVDIAFVCSGAYVELREKGSAELLVVPVVRGKTTYHSLIIARRDILVRSLGQLRGMSFAYVDPLSHTGFTYPAWRLGRLRVARNEAFRATTFTYSHERSIRLVASGVVDAAAVDSLVFDAVCRRNPEIESRVRIVEKSPPFGIPPVVVAPGLDPGLRQGLAMVLLNVQEDPDGRAALSKLGFDRFSLGDDASYDAVAQLRREVPRETEHPRP